MSKRKSATIFDFFWGGPKRSKDGDEARDWWRNLWTVLQYWQAESVKYDTCFQKSPYLPWRLKFGHLGASGYQIYFSVYRVGSRSRSRSHAMGSKFCTSNLPSQQNDNSLCVCSLLSKGQKPFNFPLSIQYTFCYLLSPPRFDYHLFLRQNISIFAHQLIQHLSCSFHRHLCTKPRDWKLSILVMSESVYTYVSE